MADSYSKLFRSITKSSIWQEPYATRIVWIMFLAERNMAGEWHGSILGVAKQAGVKLNEAERAIAALEAPDRHSKTKTDEGRRIEPIQGGWRILNHELYNSGAIIDRKEYQREWDRAHRPSGSARQSDICRTKSDQSDKGDREERRDIGLASFKLEPLDNKSSSSSPKKATTKRKSSKAREKQRVREITRDAITAYNAIMAKPHGLLSSVHPTLGFETRVKQVHKIIPTASELCLELTKSPKITPEFWESYFTSCSEDAFKSGRKKGGKGHEDWKPDFKYLVRAEVMLDTYEKERGNAEG